MPTDQPPPAQNGKLLSWLGAVKGLTVSNVLVIAMLAVVAIPVYFIWKALNDQALLDRFLSAYSVTNVEGLPCRVIKARERGEHYTWAVITGFAFEGDSRWSVGVTTREEPSQEAIRSDCAVLQAIIDFMHGMAMPPDIIWQYEDVKGREGEKGGGR
jgi:hypothetical protein